MTCTSTDDVAAMYARYPYPSPVAGRTLAYDVANLFHLLCGDDDLAGRSVLDAGCGTGQRVLGFARRYPAARFRGIDVTEASLEIARELARRHAIPNVRFERRNILQLEMGERFELIVSTGVVHYLADPRRGLENLCRHLADDGVVCVWFYHLFGEFDRLLGRELLLTLWGEERADLARGQRIMEQLQLQLPPGQYGFAGGSGANPDSDRGRLSQNADAFMHPIVHAYRFDEAMAMFAGCEVDWVAVNGINTPEAMKLVDLAEVEEPGRSFALWGAELFPDDALRELYHACGPMDRLRAVELRMKPTGFSVLAGRGDSCRRLPARVRGNAFSRGELPVPYPRVFRV